MAIEAGRTADHSAGRFAGGKRSAWGSCPDEEGQSGQESNRHGFDSSLVALVYVCRDSGIEGRQVANVRSGCPICGFDCPHGEARARLGETRMRRGKGPVAPRHGENEDSWTVSRMGSC